MGMTKVAQKRLAIFWRQPLSVSTEPGAHFQSVPSPCSEMAKFLNTTKPKAVFPWRQVEFQHCQQEISSYTALTALLQMVFRDFGVDREAENVSTCRWCQHTLFRFILLWKSAEHFVIASNVSCFAVITGSPLWVFHRPVDRTQQANLSLNCKVPYEV